MRGPAGARYRARQNSPRSDEYPVLYGAVASRNSANDDYESFIWEFNQPSFCNPSCNRSAYRETDGDGAHRALSSLEVIYCTTQPFDDFVWSVERAKIDDPLTLIFPSASRTDMCRLTSYLNQMPFGFKKRYMKFNDARNMHSVQRFGFKFRDFRFRKNALHRPKWHARRNKMARQRNKPGKTGEGAGY